MTAIQGAGPGVVPRGDAGELLGSPIKVIKRIARNLPAT